MKVFKTGSPNLVVTEPCKLHLYILNAICGVFNMCTADVLGTVISLYMQDSTLPLPTLEEVLICSKYTTEEDVSVQNTLE